MTVLFLSHIHFQWPLFFWSQPPPPPPFHSFQCFECHINYLHYKTYNHDHLIMVTPVIIIFFMFYLLMGSQTRSSPYFFLSLSSCRKTLQKPACGNWGEEKQKFSLFLLFFLTPVSVCRLSQCLFCDPTNSR